MGKGAAVGKGRRKDEGTRWVNLDTGSWLWRQVARDRTGGESERQASRSSGRIRYWKSLEGM